MQSHGTGSVQDLMSRALSEPTGLTCPRCTDSLRATTHADITVDWCDGCHGIFLDRDEPDKIMAWRRKLRRRNRVDMLQAAGEVAVEFTIGQMLGGVLSGSFDRD